MIRRLIRWTQGRRPYCRQCGWIAQRKQQRVA